MTTDTPVDLLARNNTRFQISFDVTDWGTAFDLATVAWRLQVRMTAANATVLLDCSTANGGAAYGLGIITFIAGVSAVRRLAGNYEWDFGFTPADGDFRRVGGGAIVFEQGVTR